MNGSGLCHCGSLCFSVVGVGGSESESRSTHRVFSFSRKKDKGTVSGVGKTQSSRSLLLISAFAERMAASLVSFCDLKADDFVCLGRGSRSGLVEGE